MPISKKLKNFLHCALKHLCRDGVPVWLTLLIFALTALGTYFLAPIINQKFELQKIQTEYIANNLNELNKSTYKVIADVDSYTNLLLTESKSPETKKLERDIRNEITQLHWRSIELKIIFNKNKNADLAIEEYQISLNRISNAIAGSNREEIYDATQRFAKSSAKIIDMLADKAGLKLHLEQTGLFPSL